jgi:hypothetical protein
MEIGRPERTGRRARVQALWRASLPIALLAAFAACRARPEPAGAQDESAAVGDTVERDGARDLEDAGADAHGIPHYTRRSFTADERALLRTVFGVEEPGRLYVSDSTDNGILKYDTRTKRCRTCYVNSYGIGFVSIRRPGESWDALERRVSGMRRADFGADARQERTSTADLDPSIRADVERMLADARAAGFVLHVVATYRSPEREAWLMAEGGGRTHTLTSLHSYGRAIDVVVGDGNPGHAATRARWIAFRRWVANYPGTAFRILGAPDRTWDWPHIELPSPDVEFRTVDEALVRARACVAAHAATCDFAPNLPGGTLHKPLEPLGTRPAPEGGRRAGIQALPHTTPSRRTAVLGAINGGV